MKTFYGKYFTLKQTEPRGCYETDSHPSPQFYPRRPTVNHSKQAGGDNNTNMVELRILQIHK